jgi:hypothetical protein
MNINKIEWTGSTHEEWFIIQNKFVYLQRIGQESY